MGQSFSTLVTGGTGFLGRHLVERLFAAGRSVTILGRTPAPDLEKLDTYRRMLVDHVYEIVASSAPLRGKKGSHYEGGVRVPTLAWWPGHVPAGSVKTDVTTPTRLPLANALEQAILVHNPECLYG